jgi:GTP cyclohydrolase I
VEELRTGATERVDLEAAARAIETFLTALGHAPASDAQLRDTGKLVARAFHEQLLAGYRSDPAEILRESVAAHGGDLVVVRGIAITCMCPHHLMPANGVLHLGYLPGTRVAGLGALSRLAQCLSRRLTLQETLCEEVAATLMRELDARGAACVAELHPTCLTARDDSTAHTDTVSVATLGRLRSDAQLRSEFFVLAQREART